MHTRRASLIVSLVLLACGCSCAPDQPPYDSQRAQETLIEVLDAWKQGLAADLGKRNPPIRFEDEDCRNAMTLAEYRLAKPETPLRPHDDVQVVLVLNDRQGRVVEKTVVYQVALAPDLAVLRND